MSAALSCKVWGHLLHSNRKLIHCPKVTLLNVIRFGSFCLGSKCSFFPLHIIKAIFSSVGNFWKPFIWSHIVLYSLSSMFVWLRSYFLMYSHLSTWQTTGHNPVYEPFMGDGFNISKVTPPSIRGGQIPPTEGSFPLPKYTRQALG